MKLGGKQKKRVIFILRVVAQIDKETFELLLTKSPADIELYFYRFINKKTDKKIENKIIRYIKKYE